MTATPRLSDLPAGKSARVVGLDGDEATQQRLLELGVLPGSLLRLVRTAPLGDPIEIEVLGYKLSLRKCEASTILIEAVES